MSKVPILLSEPFTVQDPPTPAAMAAAICVPGGVLTPETMMLVPSYATAW
jgi:hypothetical protein